MKKTILNALLMLALLHTATLLHGAAFDAIKDLGLKGDGVTVDNPALDKALSTGKTDIYFPKGKYLLGTVKLPGNSSLVFSPQARIMIQPDLIQKTKNGKYQKGVLFLLEGNSIAIKGLNTEGIFDTDIEISRKKKQLAVTLLVYGKDIADLRFSELTVEIPNEKKFSRTYPRPSVISLTDCRNIELANSRFQNIMHGISTHHCTDVRVHGNKAFDCNTITTFGAGSTGLKHYDNWSRKVTYQCVFRGGAPDPSRKAPKIPLGSASTVIRDLKPDQPTEYYLEQLKKVGADKVVLTPEADINYSLFGVYDIQIVNNYAEYGRTHSWGNRARSVLFKGNIGRFMNDYTYGTEACENVVFANNISINSRSAGIMTMYWGEKLVVTGNMVIVRDEPYVQEYSDFEEQSPYWGGLLRFHHGPWKKEDVAAGSNYGGGSAIISGNLLINDLTDRIRRCGVESSRDILFTNNKIKNGSIKKGGQGSLSIIGNEFIGEAPNQYPLVNIIGANEIIIKNNVASFTKNEEKKLQLKELDTAGKDEAEMAEDDEKLQESLPAIMTSSGRRSFNQKSIIVQGNILKGWQEQVIVLKAGKPVTPESPTTMVIRNNMLDGGITIYGPASYYRKIVSGNMNLTTMDQVDATADPNYPKVTKKKKKTKKKNNKKKQ